MSKSSVLSDKKQHDPSKEAETTEREITVGQYSAPDVFFSGTISSASVGRTRIGASPTDIKSKREAKIEQAVFTYIRAVRALGREEINTTEIAEALSLPVHEVNRVVNQLNKKGVKPL